jgi:hypothetical protein
MDASKSDCALLKMVLDRRGFKYQEDPDGDGLDDAIAIHVDVRDGQDGAADFGVVFLFDQSGKLLSLGAQGRR